MKISILTLFPEMFESVFSSSIINRAITNKHVEIELINFRDFSDSKHGQVDDTPYGGGSGMVIKCQPIIDALNSIKTKDSYQAIVESVKHCYALHKIYKENSKRRCILEDDSLKNMNDKAMEAIPEWLENYFCKGFITAFVQADASSLNYRVLNIHGEVPIWKVD